MWWGIKKAKLLANSGESDQMPQSVSDLGLHCLPITPLGVFRLKWVNTTVTRASAERVMNTPAGAFFLIIKYF